MEKCNFFCPLDPYYVDLAHGLDVAKDAGHLDSGLHGITMTRAATSLVTVAVQAMGVSLRTSVDEIRILLLPERSQSLITTPAEHER